MPSDRDIERLIRTVTDLVVARLGDGSPSRAIARYGGRRPEARRPKVHLLLPVPTAHADRLAAQIERLTRQGFEVRTAAAPGVLDWLQRTGLESRLGSEVAALDEAGPCDYRPRDLAVLGSLGFAVLSRLCDLDDGDPFVRLVSQALLAGVRVLAVADDLTPRGTARGPVPGRAVELLREVKRLGVEPIAGADLAGYVERLVAADTTLARSMAELLCEADVERLAASGQDRLVLSGSTIVTPLARSRAAELGLELYEVER